MNTITQSRAPSRGSFTRLNGWYSPNGVDRDLDPLRCEVSWLPGFLQEQLDKDGSPSTLKSYVVASAAFTELTHGHSKGRNELVILFLRGARRINHRVQFVKKKTEGGCFEKIHINI